MSRNTIDKKKIILQDQLYNELLNGFGKKSTQGYDDGKKYILKSQQKLRLQNVGYNFLQSDETKGILSANIKIIFESADTFKKNIIERYHELWKEEEDEEDEDDDIGEIKEEDDSFGLLKLATTVNDIYRTVELIKKGKRTYQNLKEFRMNVVKATSSDQKTGEKMLKNFEDNILLFIDGCIPALMQGIIAFDESGMIDKMWSGFVEEIWGSVGEAAAWAIAGYVAAKLTAGVGGLLVGGARAAYTTYKIQKILGRLKKLYKVSRLIYSGVNIALTIADIIDWTKEDEEKWESYIEENITQKHLVPARDQTIEKLNSANPTTKIIEATQSMKADFQSMMIDIDEIRNSDNTQVTTEDYEEQVQKYIPQTNNFFLRMPDLQQVPNTKLEIEYKGEKFDDVLEQVYGVKLSEQGKEIIQQHPRLRGFRKINDALSLYVTFLMNWQLKIFNSIRGLEIKAPEIFEKQIQILSKIREKIFYDLKKQMPEDLQGESITYSVQNYDKFIINMRRRFDSQLGYVIDDASEEPFRPISQTKYGYISAIKLNLKNNKNVDSDIFENPIYLNKRSQAGYDVVYYSESDKRGYMGYSVENATAINIVYNGETTYENGTQRIHGFTSLIENLFYINSNMKEEVKIEQSINENLNKIFEAITKRVIV